MKIQFLKEVNKKLDNQELCGLENQPAEIVAVITKKPEMLQGGGAPVFIVNDEKELQKISMTLEKIMDASAHEIDNNTLVIVAR